MRNLVILLATQWLTASVAHAFLGTELAPLLQLVTGQITEIERLTETVGVSREQTLLLRDLNEGIGRTVAQIQSVQAIIDRAQGMDPGSVRSLSDLNDLLSRARQTQQQIDDLLEAKVSIADQAITQSALQSDTSYKMGQEMVSVGSQLANESQSASPGRSAQISAAAGSAQMLAQGVELQTLAQMVQLQALTLEFHKSQVERELAQEKARQAFFEQQLVPARKKKVKP